MEQQRVGVRWALWDKVDIGDKDENGKPLLTRLRIVSTPWFGVMVHWLHRKDADRDLHDHPWPFASVIIRGGYTETYRLSTNGTVHHRRRTRFKNPVTFASFKFRHRITRVEPGTVTLILRGPKTREWGFWVDGVAWMPHYDYPRMTPYRRAS